MNTTIPSTALHLYALCIGLWFCQTTIEAQETKTETVAMPSAVNTQESSESKIQKEREPTIIGGLRGFTILSTIQFEGQADQPHHFEAIYLFPDRVRLWMSVEIENETYRRATYRHGGEVYGYDMGSGSSNGYESADRAFFFRSMELRRALFHWPEGFDWKVSEKEAVAKLTGLSNEEPLGSLHAQLDENGRPSSMRVLVPEGGEQEALQVSSWKEHYGREWPSSLNFIAGGNKIWTEVVDEVDPTRRYADIFFLPADRRPGYKPTSNDNADNEVRQIELPVFAKRVFELPKQTTWKQTEKLGREIWEREKQALAKSGRILDDTIRFEIDALGHPTFVVLHLLDSTLPPSPWKRTEARLGLMLILDNHDQIIRSRIDQMLAAIPAGTAPAPAYVRTVGDAKSSRVQIVLPLVAK
ncbi:MAG: hypothetical protein ACI8TQ_001799 [Planctomycetota bacterium]|jgi:hypothetical protein